MLTETVLRAVSSFVNHFVRSIHDIVDMYVCAVRVYVYVCKMWEFIILLMPGPFTDQLENKVQAFRSN